MKDFLLRELSIGDYVIIMKQFERGFKLAKIIKFTTKKVRVSWGDGKYCELLQDPSQLVKVDGTDLTWFLLNQKS